MKELSDLIGNQVKQSVELARAKGISREDLARHYTGAIDEVYSTPQTQANPTNTGEEKIYNLIATDGDPNHVSPQGTLKLVGDYIRVEDTHDKINKINVSNSPKVTEFITNAYKTPQKISPEMKELLLHPRFGDTIYLMVPRYYNPKNIHTAKPRWIECILNSDLNELIKQL